MMEAYMLFLIDVPPLPFVPLLVVCRRELWRDSVKQSSGDAEDLDQDMQIHNGRSYLPTKDPA